MPMSQHTPLLAGRSLWLAALLMAFTIASCNSAFLQSTAIQFVGSSMDVYLPLFRDTDLQRRAQDAQLQKQRRATTDEDLPVLLGFEPHTAVVSSIPQETTLLSVLGTGLDADWQCRVNRLSSVPATLINETHLVCPVSPSKSDDAGLHTLTLQHPRYGNFKFADGLMLLPKHKATLQTTHSVLPAYDAFHINLRMGNFSSAMSVPASVELRRVRTPSELSAIKQTLNRTLPVYRLPLHSHMDTSNQVTFSLNGRVALHPGDYRVLLTFDNQSYVETSTKLRVAEFPSSRTSKVVSYTQRNSSLTVDVRLAGATNKTISAPAAASLIKVTQNGKDLGCTAKFTSVDGTRESIYRLNCAVLPIDSVAHVSLLHVKVPGGTLSVTDPEAAARAARLQKTYIGSAGAVVGAVLVIVLIVIVMRRSRHTRATKVKPSVSAPTTSSKSAATPPPGTMYQNPLYTGAQAQETDTDGYLSVLPDAEEDHEPEAYDLDDRVEDLGEITFGFGFLFDEDVDVDEQQCFHNVEGEEHRHGDIFNHFHREHAPQDEQQQQLQEQFHEQVIGFENPYDQFDI
eukprot:m.62935 g.62935  ORF g.62935 m.62935 type:complete len:570 (+) comp11933_c0_seq2:136-1845(+)